MFKSMEPVVVVKFTVVFPATLALTHVRWTLPVVVENVTAVGNVTGLVNVASTVPVLLLRDSPWNSTATLGFIVTEPTEVRTSRSKVVLPHVTLSVSVKGHITV